MARSRTGTESEGDEEEDVLHSSLSLVHGLVDVAGLKGNVDQGGDQVGGWQPSPDPPKSRGHLSASDGIIVAGVSPGGAEAVSIAVALADAHSPSIL